MSSPCELIRVKCPNCSVVYQDWTRASMNLGLDDFDDDYVRRASTASCPVCDCTINLDVLVVREGLVLDDRFPEDLAPGAILPRFSSWNEELRHYTPPPVSRNDAWRRAEDMAEGTGATLTDVKPGHLFQDARFAWALEGGTHQWWVVLGRRSPRAKRVPVYAFSKLDETRALRIDGRASTSISPEELARVSHPAPIE